ncbi:MAG: hypothetical protein IT374_21155 [Polyangiaceae bacterium]|nr:hypothetical protein [Polyangiaceae bacterium]
MRHPTLLALIGLAALAPAPACDTYHPAPVPTLVGPSDNILPDTSAPIEIAFKPAVVASTLNLKIVRYDTDAEGNLYDEDADPATQLEVLFSTQPGAPDVGGTHTVSPDGASVSIKLDKEPPVGPRLAIVLEPGTESVDGSRVEQRKLVKFGYKFECGASGQGSSLPSGGYFFLIDLEAPIPGLQIQLYGLLKVDSKTGHFVGQFTNADRTPGLPGCAMDCGAKNVCRTKGVASPTCVMPSERPTSTDEFGDFYANDKLPVGFSFTVSGCADDRGGVTNFAIEPTDVKVTSPAVTVQKIKLSAQFKEVEPGVFRGQGSMASPQVLLGTIESGEGRGTLNARSLTEAEWPASGIPGPP